MNRQTDETKLQQLIMRKSSDLKNDCVVRNERVVALLSRAERQALNIYILKTRGTLPDGRIPVGRWLREIILSEIGYKENEKS